MEQQQFVIAINVNMNLLCKYLSTDNFANNHQPIAFTVENRRSAYKQLCNKNAQCQLEGQDDQPGGLGLIRFNVPLDI